MKKFSFRLDPYLQVCRHREQLEQLKLNEMMNEELRIRDSLREQTAGVEKVSRELASKREIHVFEVSWYRQRMDFIRSQIAETENRLEALLERIAGQRQLLVEARKKRRIVEKLREHRHQRYQVELDRAFQNEMDDLFLMGRAGRPFLAD